MPIKKILQSYNWKLNDKFTKKKRYIMLLLLASACVFDLIQGQDDFTHINPR